MRPSRTALALWSLLCFYSSIACSPTSAAARDTTSIGKTPPPARERPGAEPSSRELPVDPDDGVWGEPSAPVTILIFTDLECPYCAQAHQVLTELERRYGEKRLRVVIKHLPLSRHAGAIPAARVAQAVLAMAGPGKFFEYLDRAFADQERVALGRALEIAVPLGLDLEALRARAASAAIGAQVVRDVALADKVGVPATPHFRVNGLGVTGAQPVELMVRVIEAELIEVARLLGAGVPPESAYARRVVANLSEPEPKL